MFKSGDNKLILGLPPFLCRKAKEYSYEIIAENVLLEIPLEVEPKFAKSAGIDKVMTKIHFKSGKDLEIFDLSRLLHMLLVHKKYPNLGDDEVYSVTRLVLDKDSNRIIVVGNVLRECPDPRKITFTFKSSIPSEELFDGKGNVVKDVKLGSAIGTGGDLNRN